MQFIGAFFVLLLALVGWIVLWMLIKDPESPFFLRGHAHHHGIEPEEALNRVRVFFNSEEVVDARDISNLLSVSEEEAEIYLEYLEEEGELERLEDDGVVVYVRKGA